MAVDKLSSTAIRTGDATVLTGNGAALKSWGYARWSKYGKLVIVDFGGFYFTSNISSATGGLSVPFRAKLGATITIAKDSAAIALIDPNSSTVQFNAVTANQNLYGQLVFLTED